MVAPLFDEAIFDDAIFDGIADGIARAFSTTFLAVQSPIGLVTALAVTSPMGATVHLELLEIST